VTAKDPSRATQPPWLTGGLIATTLIAFWVAPLDSAASADASSSWFWDGALAATASPLAPQALTAHFLHTDTAHLLWNLLGLAVLGVALERFSRTLLMAAVLAGMAAVTLWFHTFADSTHYVGWSGVLNSLLVCCLYSLYLPSTSGQLATSRSYQNTTRWINNLIVVTVAIGALSKTAWEIAFDQALITHTLWPPAPAAHLAGLTAGTLVCIVRSLLTRRRYSPISSFQS